MVSKVVSDIALMASQLNKAVSDLASMTDFNLSAEEAAIVEKVREGLVSIRKTKAKPA